MSKSFKIDLTGQRFGRLTVLEFVPNEKVASCWKCKCDCGNITIVQAGNLRNGNSVSCSCYRKSHSITHGMSHTRLNNIWFGMKQRCYDSNYNEYSNYGGRGITVCDEWRNDFQAFYDWAMANGYEEGLSIDRIDNNQGYSPENCRWATNKVQCRNRRSNVLVEYDGQMITLKEAAERAKIKYGTLWWRYKHGYRGEKLFSECNE